MLSSLLVLSAMITCQLPAQAAFAPQAPAAAAAPGNDKREVKMSPPEVARAPYGMVNIPGGESVMGTDPEAVLKLAQGDQLNIRIISAESPRHTIKVESFYIDETEVTNLQWKVFLQATGRKPSEALTQYGWPGGEIPEGQDYFPITNVNLPEIEDFLAWCGKRLPTEAEWTRAARGDDTRTYPWGDKWNGKVVQYGGNPPNMPVAVDSFPEGKSPYGVLNMAGNVLEWVDASYTAFEGFEAPSIKQGKERIILSPGFDSRRRVVKGGCFASTRDQSRIDFRQDVDPSDSDAGLGFRGARSAMRGMELVRHAHRRLLPAMIPTANVLDDTDVFVQEVPTFLANSDGRVIESYRYLAFAHPKPERRPGLSKMRDDSVDAPVTLGLLSTSENMLEPALPHGDYVVAFKGRGESKQHREARRNGKDKGKDKDKEAGDEATPENGKGKGEGQDAADELSTADAESVATDAAGSGNRGGIAPWPGIGVADIDEDIDFPQDKDVLLFYNVNNVVVAWLPILEVREGAMEPLVARESNSGAEWEIEFSLDVVAKRVPRFVLPIKLHGKGLVEP